MTREISDGSSFILNFKQPVQRWHENFSKSIMQPSRPPLIYWVRTFFSVLGCSVLFLAGRAQGPQQLVSVPVGNGITVNGWLYLPADYQSSTKQYPVVLFYHGAGEAGTNPYLMFNNGIPQLISQGMRPDNILNPVDGQRYSFIVLSLQHWSWSPDPEWLPLQVSWLKQRYRIDTSRIYLTGLSAGGQEVFKSIVTSASLSKLVAAAAPMSPPAMGNYDMSLVRIYRIKTWFFSGNSDPLTPTVQHYYAQCDSASPGSSRMYVYSGGHCCWNTCYNISWREPLSGLSLWQWFLAFRKEAPLFLKFTDFKVTDLGNKIIRIDFSCENPNGNENFFIRIKVNGIIRKVEVSYLDRIGTNQYSKTINLN